MPSWTRADPCPETIRTNAAACIAIEWDEGSYERRPHRIILVGETPVAGGTKGPTP